MANVYVGLSGGVDSAVSAALLKRAGHSVVGCFIKIWQPEFIECTWREDRLDAMRVCAVLGISFREIDLSEEYKKEVVDSMVADYARGITPNPDVLCNRSIKFGHFLTWARKEGAEMIATGHYARISGDRNSRHLLRGADASKDQSYFLYRLGQDDLSKTLFPVGEFTKRKIRSLAKRFGLPNAEKPDSQGLCFVGPVLDRRGEVIGEHKGAALYTVGERHGFNVEQGDANKGPLYVISVDTEKNSITVSPDKHDAARSEVALTDVHWIEGEPGFPFEADVEARYREVPIGAHVDKQGGSVHVSFVKPHLVSPGQSLVVYDGERCMGGGSAS